MAIQSHKPVWGQIHTSRRAYQLWAKSVGQLAKTPRSLQKPREEASDLELAAALIKEHRSDLIQLWETFTSERADVSRYLMDPKRESLVYLLGFHLANQARTLGVLQRLQARTGLFDYLNKQKDSLQLLDLGCGSGALSLTTAEELRTLSPQLALRSELVDKSQAFLDAAIIGMQNYLPESEIVTRRQKLDDYLSREVSEGPKDGLVWYQLGYVWNEIVHSPKTSQLMLRFLEAGLKKGRRLITVIEPASQDLARAAMELRDELVERGYRVLYPCPHQEPCPMLERTRDWCYSEFAWERPPLVKTVDKMLSIERHRIGCSGYIFASPDLVQSLLAQAGSEPKREEAVVVGRPLKLEASKKSRAFEYLLCTPAGLQKDHPTDGPELLRGQTWDKPQGRDNKKTAAPKQKTAQATKSLEGAKPVQKKVKAKAQALVLSPVPRKAKKSKP